MKNVLIHSPYAESTGQGNAVTADRLDAIFRESGYEVIHSAGDYAGQSADGMIALNARKSAKAVARFRYLHPGSGLVIILTGTDINHPDVMDETSPTWISMKLADQLVVLHEASLQQVPEKFREKTRVIYPSVTLPKGLVSDPMGDHFSVIMAGNMRWEKNPGLAVAASEKIPDHLEIHLYGSFSEASSGRVVKHGMVPHHDVLTAMSEGHVLLNTSVQEGGANAVCEAISMGLPVVASAIPGNIGMLGEDYEGLFTSNNLDELVSLLSRVASDQELYGRLKNQVAVRAPLFAYATEAAAWTELLRSELSH